MTQYVLAQHKSNISLLDQCFSEVSVGESIWRMPGGRRPGNAELFMMMPDTHKEKWTVVKVFSSDEGEKIRALIELAGFKAIANLFKISVVEPVPA